MMIDDQELFTIILSFTKQVRSISELLISAEHGGTWIPTIFE